VEAGSFAEGLVGIVLDGRYRLDALLGEGGMGAVFRAHHLPTDRRVAVKLLKPHLTNDTTALERFAREARSTMRVESPHAVKVLDFGITPRSDYYMALEYVDGRTVQRELDVDGPFTPARVVHIARQALHALAAAHEQGLVHRDIKPENIILTHVGDDHDYAKLLDFGVAKLMEGAARSDRSALALTQQGMVFGTCEFMSPEQACGQQVDARSDLYSLAATMFGMLTGCGMYVAKTPLEWLMAHARQPPPHLADAMPELAPLHELDALLQRCLAKHREQRPQTARELASLLARLAPTLAGGTPLDPRTSATLLPVRATKSSESAYVEALPSGTLLPSPSESVPAPPRRSRAWVLAVIALAVVGVIVATVLVAMRDKGKPIADRPSPIAGSNAPAPAPADAQVVASEPPADASVPADAPPPAVVAHPVEAPKVGNKELMQHLVNAEQAKTAGNRLREIAEADAVLRLDPKHLRAHILIADGLIATGSIDSGCKYLHGLGKNPTAHALQTSAGCPSD
jgi:serine/threonine-protein kinase